MQSFKVLFRNGISIDPQRIRQLVSRFSKSYDQVVRTIITNSATINEDIFRSNVATLMPSFLMTRRGAFHGLMIEGGTIRDPKHALDKCWKQVDGELQNLKNFIGENSSSRTRAILELSPEPSSYIIGGMSELFERLKWTTIKGSDIGRVGASKVLFAVFPEIALPVDNDEWDYVFRTDCYGKLLSIMVGEVKEWEAKSNVPFESLGVAPTTVPSIYNVMAMDAREGARREITHRV